MKGSPLLSRSPLLSFLRADLSPSPPARREVLQVDGAAQSLLQPAPLPADLSFSWRASLLGSVTGTVITVSNMYLGLKTGITMGATLFGTLLGGAVLQPIVGADLTIQVKLAPAKRITAQGSRNTIAFKHQQLRGVLGGGCSREWVAGGT